MRRRRLRQRGVRGWVAALTAVLVAAALVVVGLDLSGRLPGGLVADTPATTPTHTATPIARPLDPTPSAAPAVLLPEPTDPAAAGQPASAVRVAALRAVLTSGRLGPDPGALVLDVASGQPVLERAAGVPRIPASVLKLLTGATVLSTMDPTQRLSTRVVAGGAPGELVLVGGGDTTLTRASDGGAYPVQARLSELADATAAALQTDGRVRVRVDDSLFSGPAVSPDWPADYVASGEVSPVSALTLDGGRVGPTSPVREADPALATGQAFARMLSRRGVDVAPGVRRADAAPGGAELAAVSSAPVGELVELMLASSDNDLAESLLRLAAVASGREGTFIDGTVAVTEVLVGLGLPADGLQALDGSGLARGSAVAPKTLAGLLVAAADGSRPELGALLDGLPVAGFSGTLTLRYDGGLADAAAGLVRAKTGTLTGVGALAGVASVAGRPVVFVVMSDGVPDTLAARDALDRFAVVLVGRPGRSVRPDGAAPTRDDDVR